MAMKPLKKQVWVHIGIPANDQAWEQVRREVWLAVWGPVQREIWRHVCTQIEGGQR